MERHEETGMETADARQRCNEWIELQREYLLGEFVSACTAIGMEQQHIERLLSKFFPNMGNMYRETSISRTHMEDSLRLIGSRLIRHAGDHKYFLSAESGRDVGWSETIDSICGVAGKTETLINHDDRAAFHDVFFPAVRDTGGKNGWRLRTVVHFDPAQPELQDEHNAEPVDLFELEETFRRRMGGVLLREHA